MTEALTTDELRERVEALESELKGMRQQNRKLRQLARISQLNEAKLNEVYKIASIFSWEVRTLTGHLECSDGLLLRTDDGPLQIEDLFDSVDPASRDAVQQAYESCVEDGNPRELKHDIFVADGSRLTVEHCIKAFRSESGIPLKTVGIVLDVTERERLASSLDEERERVTSILEAVGEGVYAIDQVGQITLANRAAAEALGRSYEELLGLEAHTLLQHDDLEGAAPGTAGCPLHSNLSSDTSTYRAEHTFRRKDGVSIPVACVGTPVHDSTGAVSGAVVTFRDLTEERHQRAQLAQAQKLESIGQLAAGIAHEINTPAQYVGDNLLFLEESFGELGTLMAKYGELRNAARDAAEQSEIVAAVDECEEDVDLEFLLEEIPRALAQSRDGIERVAEIVRAMKEFSHPGSHEKKPIDLNRAIQSTITVATNEWKYVADIETEFEPLPQVPCLAGEFNQVILNIVVNAAQALEEIQEGEGKGKIFVRTKREGEDAISIEIQDTGPGMPDAVRNRIFDPFFTTKEVGKGTGQGLAIAHSVVVDKHHGTIQVESEVGQGTTFRIVLPVHPEDQKEAIG